jgi:hypothetical protein
MANQVTDGSYRIAAQTGADEYTLPFSDVGDQISFEVKRIYRVDYNKFVRSKPMSQINSVYGKAYLVEEGPANPIGNGLLEFPRIYASVPQRRVEGSSYVYSVQFLSTNVSYDPETPTPEPSVTEFPVTLSARIVYEYFIGRPAPLIAPRVAVIYGTVITFGGWGTLLYNQEYLAEDSEVSIYKGNIYQRRSIYIRYPVRPGG